MSQPITPHEFEVLKGWYKEWAALCRVLATFSFASIATTFLIFELKPGSTMSEEQTRWIKVGVACLGVAGLLAGVSIILAFTWIDAISRRCVPTLSAELFVTRGVKTTKYLGLGGWVLSTLAVLLALTGLSSIAWAIYRTY